ncbi:MAG TPA: acylphosphatase [Candidatus Gracilibacteria bacterium]|nr:acylphosphatase [Candidatus Gracilibacteria bacterium]
MQATIHIKGRVQGVFFRSAAKEEAEKRGLFGWIKNENDGSVSACVQGLEADIREFSIR